MNQDRKNPFLKNTSFTEEDKLQALLSLQEFPPPSPGFEERILNQIKHATKHVKTFSFKEWLGFYRQPKAILGISLVLLIGFVLGFLQEQGFNSAEFSEKEEIENVQWASFNYEENNPWILED